MTKGRDTRQKEGKKQPAKTLKEKRADKASKRDGTFKDPESVGKLRNHKP